MVHTRPPKLQHLALRSAITMRQTAKEAQQAELQHTLFMCSKSPLICPEPLYQCLLHHIWPSTPEVIGDKSLTATSSGTSDKWTMRSGIVRVKRWVRPRLIATRELPVSIFPIISRNASKQPQSRFSLESRLKGCEKKKNLPFAKWKGKS